MTRHGSALMLVLAVVGCGQEAAIDRGTTEADIAALTVALESLPAVVPVEGSVAARRRAEIGTRMMARITSFPAEVGTEVAPGQLLVQLGSEDVAATRAKAEAAAKAAQVARDEAARQATRMDTLLAQDVVPAAQRDAAHLGLAQAEAQLALAQATLREVETAASSAAIRAPFTGAVVARFADEGDIASPGMPLLVIEDAGPRDGVFAVPADVAARLRPGMPLRVTAPDGRSADASVRAVAAGADPMTHTVEVRVVLPAEWPTGVAATGFFPAGTVAGIAVPASVIIRRGQLTGVRVLTTRGVAVRWVRLGRSVGTGDRVQVLSGLEPGDRIAL